jgi:hypothetical protein
MNALDTPATATAETDAPATPTAATAATATAEAATAGTVTVPAVRREADGMAVASFVLGLVGLLIFNVVLGPVALVLAGLALSRGTSRRGRALFGLTLGAADLIVLAAAASADQSFSWSIAG